ncbi:DUF937 domain-containing protein [Hansschlegelia zhihuaiae]|uniref:DUF937 domain-containing protein n=1 Tax=Hansschlegelia zhihuaiae TaxID=405005 RepID=A0A4Q0MIW3_9HYPH|nr:DUF937 domain-containing protein [Hansschlegelia zhihuaiae]RXF73303.1 DUF937 domain-containing protein [Hansschlegelia zhihuaiae]
MLNMFDLFRQAQGGAAFDNLARAYGVTPDQLRAMTAALTPAFAQGFQRQAQNDEAARRFADLFQTEAYARAFEMQAAALDPATRGAGENALDALFGSKEVSRAVAAQASAASGVQAKIIREVLPVLASILMGGFMKAAQGAAGGSGATFPGVFGDMFSRADKAPDAPQNPFQPWIDAFSQAQPQAGGQAASNPLGEMMGEWMKGVFGVEAAKPEPEPEPPSGEEPPAGGGDAARPAEPADPFDDLVATGRELSAQNAEAMSRIFDAFFTAEKKRKG